MKIYRYEREHLDRLRSMLPECTVLLKKDGSFPLKWPEKVALYGGGARHTIKGGTGSGEVNSRFSISVERALKKAGFEITSKDWLDAYDQVLAQAKIDFVKDIKKRARAKRTLAVMEGMGAVMTIPEYELPLEAEGELAIYVLDRISGEGNDRSFVKGDILLSDSEVRDILALNESFAKFMLVLNVGGPVDLSPVKDVKNILLLSQLGVETGTALVDIILGKAYPSGKLATSWAYQQDIPTIGDFGGKHETRYQEGIYVGYRYYDTLGIENDFAFGYGLSYTDFSITCLDMIQQFGKIKITANVLNTGDYAGKEVVQLYVSLPEGRLDQPYQTLAAFGKTLELEPGESEDLHLEFDLKDLAGYDEENSAYILEEGDYIVRLGNSSKNTEICGVIRVPKTMITLKAKPCCGKADFEDWKPDFSQKRDRSEEMEMIRELEVIESFKTVGNMELSSSIKVIVMEAGSILSSRVIYDRPEEIDPFIDRLSDEELAYINIGHFNPKAGIMSVIGNASSKVAGAAGETTDILEDKGFPVMVMADGPAGLRLVQKYAKAKGKIYPLGSGMPAAIEDFLPKVALTAMKLMSPKPPRTAKVKEQYCTAIPIGTAIAQSFNYDLAVACGDIVGAEMERFGVHLWLAPALNIHRSMRCGRNFEYYSEDPLVSGLCAAAITEGVQKHPGCGTTIKHYAANNQETARYTNNSQVSERAMREIYLKGFGICIRKAQPKAVMTSYNLLNGIHTSERRDLTQEILRSEYGFKGIVMTDWVIAMMKDKDAIYDIAHAAKVAAAGGDLFMPGSKADYEELLQALQDERIDRDQIKKNATRVYRMALELAGKGE